MTLSFYGIVIDHIEEILSDKNNVVIFLTCDGVLLNCFKNRLQNPMICHECKTVGAIGLKSLSKYKERFLYHSIGNLTTKFDRTIHNFEYVDIYDVKKIQYRNVKIGYGALSSYVSYTRNQDADFKDEQTKSYLDDLLISQIRLTDAISILIEKYKPAEMHVYNGRWADVRPMYDLAKAYSIHVSVLEALNDGKRTFFKEVYPNVLPQNIDYRTKWINEIWEKSSKSYEEKVRLAERFFEKRRNAELARDVKVYTSNQIQGKLPDNWDSTKKNVVIFNSSEDEFVALGNDYDAYALFPNQIVGIKEILDKVQSNSNYQFYLRIHPNLSDVEFSYHKDLLSLGSNYPNLTVIPGDSPVSTYTLIDEADKVIVFSSSVGFEACYWGKPSILLSGSGYYNLDVTYTPKDLNEVISLIFQDNLPAKSKEGAIKFAYFLMDTKYRTTEINLNPKAAKLFGKELGSTFIHLKVSGSSYLFRIIWEIWIKYLSKRIRKLYKSKYENIPVSERNDK